MGKEMGLPSNYLGKVLQALARCLLVKSNRGRLGGYRLAKPPSEITLLDVLSAVECVGRYERCLLGYPVCPGSTTCPLHTAWGVAQGTIRDIFSKTTLEELARHDELAERARRADETGKGPEQRAAAGAS